MTFDDWRGADKISAKGKSAEERTRDKKQISARIAHARRQAEGRGMSKSGGLWARQIRSWHLSAKTKGSE